MLNDGKALLDQMGITEKTPFGGATKKKSGAGWVSYSEALKLASATNGMMSAAIKRGQVKRRPGPNGFHEYEVKSLQLWSEGMTRKKRRSPKTAPRVSSEFDFDMFAEWVKMGTAKGYFEKHRVLFP